MISLRAALRDATSDLHELDDDIAHVQAVLEDLRRKREALQEFAIKHDAFLAPIRQLPAEILAEIFIYCMPNYGNSSFNPHFPPFLLGRVCIGWRQVASSTQVLWSSITVNPYWPSHKMAKLWIERAISAPLTIHLDSTGPSREGPIQPAIAVLAQYCDRWKDLDIRIEETMVSRLNSIRHRLPWLETLRIQNPRESRLWCQSQELNIFELAPRLHNVSLARGISHTSVKIPWNQLTELNVHAANFNECLETLQLVPNLVKCTVYALSRFQTASLPSQNSPVLTFSYLRSFSIFCLGPPEGIFRHLKLPIIYAFHIACETDRHEDSWLSRQSLMPLLSCSSHALRKLEIGRLIARDSAHIAWCLRATPWLAQLTLRGSEDWVTADLLRLFTRLPDIEVLVPDLEVLEISARHIPCYECMSMIESRWRAPASAQLKRLHIGLVSPEDWQMDVVKLLLKYRQEGMAISIITKGNRDLLETLCIT